MSTAAELLAAYDAQLRGEQEGATAQRSTRLGPLRLFVFGGGRGFITYRDLGGLAGPALASLVAEARDALAADPAVTEVEWKTRGHDRAPGLHAALLAGGFEPQEQESIMIGPAELLALELPLPDGVSLRRVTEPGDVRRASLAADELFGDPPNEARVVDLIERVRRGGEVWIAEADGEIVSTGRMDPVVGTEFAGIWGGATRPGWRRRGIYRALTAARARSALERGVRYLSSDSTEYSRPILERSGFVRVSTTTPYEWRR
ncbi:MAG: GNAT family N-acetyltransferase [Acidobacteria bacterium]|nr:GNAT family N-acetyltransferase [Acidobacteriota bacterium]